MIVTFRVEDRTTAVAKPAIPAPIIVIGSSIIRRTVLFGKELIAQWLDKEWKGGMVSAASSLSQSCFKKGITNPLGMARCSCQTPGGAKIQTLEMRKAIVIRREVAKE
jgi:hypothetical protein